MTTAEPVRAETVVATGLLSRAVVVEHLSCCQRFNTDAGRKWGTNGLFSFSATIKDIEICVSNIKTKLVTNYNGGVTNYNGT